MSPHDDDALSSRALDPRWVERISLSDPTVGEVRLVCVDGPAGSGKTTLALALADALAPAFGDVPVVHGDEVYEGWAVVAGAPDRIAAFAALGARLERWLLERWRHGWDGEHPRWDWYADAWGDSVVVPVSPVVILEGVALGSRLLRAGAALTFWVDADDDVRLDRVLARDGEAIRTPMQGWLRDEAAWHLLDETAESADIRLRT
jgi:uridine kinase